MSTKTGHLFYVPLAPICRRLMLASLKLKPEVNISELIARCDAIPGQHIDLGMLNMLNVCRTEVLWKLVRVTPQNTRTQSVGDSIKLYF